MRSMGMEHRLNGSGFWKLGRGHQWNVVVNYVETSFQFRVVDSIIHFMHVFSRTEIGIESFEISNGNEMAV